MTCEKWFIWAVNMSSSSTFKPSANYFSSLSSEADLGHNQLKCSDTAGERIDTLQMELNAWQDWEVQQNQNRK